MKPTFFIKKTRLQGAQLDVVFQVNARLVDLSLKC